MYIYYQNIQQVEGIYKVEAKIAVLRMLLKAKLKKNMNSIDSKFKSDKVFLNIIKPKFEETCHLQFNAQGDFQKLIDMLKAVYETIATEIEKKSQRICEKIDEPVQTKSGNIWELLVKYCPGQLNLIKDIAEATAELKNAIDLYNSENDHQFKKKFKAPELVVINDFDNLVKYMIEADEKDHKKETEEKFAA